MPTRNAATVVPPVRLTERLLIAGLTIKDDLTKAWKAWEDNFRDPVKEALLAGPQAEPPAVTERIIGGVRVFLAKTFPKAAFDTQRMAVTLSQGVASGGITLADLRTLLDSRALTVNEPEAVAGLLAARLGVQAASFVIQPENPTVPTRVDLKWTLQPSAPVVGILHGLPEQIALAAAGTTGRPVSTGVPSPALQAAMDIDRANAAAIQTPPPPAPGQVTVRRPSRRRGQ
jgi:hypothetical protein